LEGRFHYKASQNSAFKNVDIAVKLGLQPFAVDHQAAQGRL
jgi:hypothetical protein